MKPSVQLGCEGFTSEYDLCDEKRKADSERDDGEITCDTFHESAEQKNCTEKKGKFACYKIWNICAETFCINDPHNEIENAQRSGNARKYIMVAPSAPPREVIPNETQHNGDDRFIHDVFWNVFSFFEAYIYNNPRTYCAEGEWKIDREIRKKREVNHMNHNDRDNH